MGLLSACREAACTQVCEVCPYESATDNFVKINLQDLEATLKEQDLMSASTTDGSKGASLLHCQESVLQMMSGLSQLPFPKLLSRSEEASDEDSSEKPISEDRSPVERPPAATLEESEDTRYWRRLEAAARLAREEEERQRIEEEERQREEEAEEAARKIRELARREAQEQARKEREQVNAFLKANHFTGVRERRKTLFKSCYPLHVAVVENNVEMVQLLLRVGADCEQKNSSGQTPGALAQKLNANGSHEQVLHLLGAR